MCRYCCCFNNYLSCHNFKKAWAEAREFKLTAAKETRNTCSYCSVGCGTLLYSTGAANGNIKQKIFHVEGDPDYPVSRGALCPKGAGLSGFVNSEQRLKFQNTAHQVLTNGSVFLGMKPSLALLS